MKAPLLLGEDPIHVSDFKAYKTKNNTQLVIWKNGFLSSTVAHKNKFQDGEQHLKNLEGNPGQS